MALLEHGVHQGGLAMVYMGDDGDIPDILWHKNIDLKKKAGP
jgi:hypothetical protein